jgi:hypothetical protein
MVRAMVVLSSVASTRIRVLHWRAGADFIETGTGHIDFVVYFDFPTHSVELTHLMRTVGVARYVREEEAVEQSFRRTRAQA